MHLSCGRHSQASFILPKNNRGNILYAGDFSNSFFAHKSFDGKLFSDSNLTTKRCIYRIMCFILLNDFDQMKVYNYFLNNLIYLSNLILSRLLNSCSSFDNYLSLAPFLFYFILSWIKLVLLVVSFHIYYKFRLSLCFSY